MCTQPPVRLGSIRSEWVACEVEAMTPVLVAKTVDRSVVGTLVDFAKLIPYYLPEPGWDDDEMRGGRGSPQRDSLPSGPGRRSRDLPRRQGSKFARGDLVVTCWQWAPSGLVARSRRRADDLHGQPPA